MSEPSTVTLIATAAFGLEAVVARELSALGYTDTRISDGRVEFSADLSAICRANLWLRVADRVLVLMGRFDSVDFDQLFDGAGAIPWETWIQAVVRPELLLQAVQKLLAPVPSTAIAAHDPCSSGTCRQMPLRAQGIRCERFD